jgi:carbon monoxide dehydrogenase subunit G
MKVQLEKKFALPASADIAWSLLQEIEKVAGCMPGAKITERVSERLYKGTVAVKLGPASMSFRGDVEVMALEPASRTLRIVGRGTDSTGSSGASMDLTARVEAIDSSSCTLVGVSEVSMSGKAAAFGGRMMNSVADQLMKQFATNLTAEVQALQARSQGPSAPAEAPTGTSAAGEGPAPVPAPVAPPAPTQLNALALLWAVIKDWLRSLFSAKKA